MKSAIKKIFVLAGCVLLFVTSMRAQRACLNLSETLWNITLDRSAVWQNDSLYVPPVNIHRPSKSIQSPEHLFRPSQTEEPRLIS